MIIIHITPFQIIFFRNLITNLILNFLSNFELILENLLLLCASTAGVRQGEPPSSTWMLEQVRRGEAALRVRMFPSRLGSEPLWMWECGCRRQWALLDARRRWADGNRSPQRLAAVQVNGLSRGCGLDPRTVGCRAEQDSWICFFYTQFLRYFLSCREETEWERSQEGFPSTLEPRIAGSVSTNATDTQESPHGSGLVTAGIAPQLFQDLFYSPAHSGTASSTLVFRHTGYRNFQHCCVVFFFLTCWNSVYANWLMVVCVFNELDYLHQTHLLTDRGRAVSF